MSIRLRRTGKRPEGRLARIAPAHILNGAKSVASAGS